MDYFETKKNVLCSKFSTMMRILFVICLCLPFLSYAQQTFAPVGAEWWYSGNYYDYIAEQSYDRFNPAPPNYTWVTHVQSVGDTVIAGISCRHLVCSDKVRMATNPDSIRSGGNRSVFVYDNTDTVFVYSGNAGRFIPLYIFNVSAGDTVCLSGLFNWLGDTTFCYVVDSIRMALYDTSHLKTYYTHTLIEHTYYSINWGKLYWVNGSVLHKGQYTEKLGGTMAEVGGLYPTLSTRYSDGNYSSNIGPFFGTLNCYNDTAHAIKLTPLNCDFILHPGYLSLEDKKSLPSYISVYPNPVNERIMITSTKKLNADADIRVFDITGKEIAHLKLGKTEPKISYDTQALPEGLYLLRLNMEDAAYYYKMMIRH